MLTASSFVLRHVFLFAALLTYVLSAQQAGAVATVVYDPRSGHVLSQSNAGDPWYPASLTKLLTAYIAFKAVKEGKTKLSDKITMSNDLVPMCELNLGSSLCVWIVQLSLLLRLVQPGNQFAVQPQMQIRVQSRMFLLFWAML